ncbi:hypothetical protein ASZ90_009371 [hydrocarbon metagenome]|uniref:Uncharacterized protein n=1 Tax=hydrocarbon metagenome TaxID=938273 RepID=A0A0W8FKP5_9ZZZZ|nr:hypothetical protein [Methanomicrobiaceae archaeon]
MDVRTEKQQAFIERVQDILSSTRELDRVREALGSLGFIVKGEHGGVVSMEHADAELFIQLRFNEEHTVISHNIVTYDEIIQQQR